MLLLVSETFEGQLGVNAAEHAAFLGFLAVFDVKGLTDGFLVLEFQVRVQVCQFSQGLLSYLSLQLLDLCSWDIHEEDENSLSNVLEAEPLKALVYAVGGIQVMEHLI